MDAAAKPLPSGSAVATSLSRCLHAVASPSSRLYAAARSAREILRTNSYSASLEPRREKAKCLILPQRDLGRASVVPEAVHPFVFPSSPNKFDGDAENALGTGASQETTGNVREDGIRRVFHAMQQEPGQFFPRGKKQTSERRRGGTRNG